jgi:hypothetical protein
MLLDIIGLQFSIACTHSFQRSRSLSPVLALSLHVLSGKPTPLRDARLFQPSLRNTNLFLPSGNSLHHPVAQTRQAPLGLIDWIVSSLIDNRCSLFLSVSNDTWIPFRPKYPSHARSTCDLRELNNFAFSSCFSASASFLMASIHTLKNLEPLQFRQRPDTTKVHIVYSVFKLLSLAHQRHQSSRVFLQPKARQLRLTGRGDHLYYLLLLSIQFGPFSRQLILLFLPLLRCKLLLFRFPSEAPPPFCSVPLLHGYGRSASCSTR